MKILPAKGKTSKKRRNEKLFGASKLRRIKTSWKEKAIKERVIKVVGKLSKPSVLTFLSFLLFHFFFQ